MKRVLAPTVLLAVSAMVLVACAGVAAAQGVDSADDELRVAALPPVVVQTVPRAGDTQVNPWTSEIRVTFSKDMAEGNWSWTQISDETFPRTTGKPRYLRDKRTCVLPVKLEPGRAYVLWLNSEKFRNFKDAEGRSAVPYLLVFETSAHAPKRSWGPEQATGEPDTPEAGDITTAWASRQPDDSQEWLLLEYAKPIRAKEIQVHETYNPGALCKVTVFDAGGKEVEVWQGEDPTKPGSEKGVSKIPVNVPFAISKVKLYLDSAKVPGWNEIDAVGLVERSGEKVHWAASATASSTFAEYSGGEEFPAGPGYQYYRSNSYMGPAGYPAPASPVPVRIQDEEEPRQTIRER